MNHDDDAGVVHQAVRDEIARGEDFSNLHGITRENLEAFLVPPFRVVVDPDDLETQTRPMWVVLQESASATQGRLVVYDPGSRDRWGVAEHVRDGEYVLVTAAPSLSKALEDM